MATVKPFNGVRYTESNLSPLICPPYDIIPPEKKEFLMKQSSDNMVRLELPDALGGKNKYQQARSIMSSWLREGVLFKDDEPGFYFYEQGFLDHGERKVRRGFFAALKLENPQKGDVKPHEKTLAKPKEDRLKLLRSVKTNVSPIFGLFHDKKKQIVNLSKRVAALEPLAGAKDREGVSHKLWKVSDSTSVGMITKALALQQIFIADGHHRYETAWNYSQERRKKDKKYSPKAEYNYVMIFLCPMSDPGLSIWPTHRVVEAPVNLDQRIAEYFDVLPADRFEKLESKSPQPLLLSYKGKRCTLVVKNKNILPKMMPEKCKAYRDLGVSILHSLLLQDVPADKITYVKDREEAYKLAKQRGHCAVIVPPTPIEAVQEIALAGQTMPQKSTYFYPKVATGLVLHSLE